MTEKLTLYNGALRECGERKLASLTENREPRRLLDDEWSNGLVDFVLGEGQWRFARRTVELAADPGIDPVFGYSNAFQQPDDFIRTCALCQDERMNVPLLQYQIENGIWYADVDPIYLTYVSNHVDFGGDLGRWPADFVLWVETYLASKIANRLTGSRADRDELIKLAEKRKRKALNSDAMESPTQFPPMGSFARARLGRTAGTMDRGRRDRLIG